MSGCPTPISQHHCRECRNTYARMRRHLNPSKSAEAQRAWREANPEKIAQYAANRKAAGKARKDQLRLYGLTPAGYEAMHDSQGGLCAICSKPPTYGCLQVDHDHVTGKVRALLCGNCNKAIGLLRDEAPRLLSAYWYLLQHSEELFSVDVFGDGST